MKKVLVTGAKGFLAGYIIPELLQNGYQVTGIDNNSKYGPVTRSFDTNPDYTFIEGDAKDLDLMKEAIQGCSHFIANAAMIGGISYFHEFAYDLLAENERITAAAFDAALDALKYGILKKITVLSSSMVFENTAIYPTPEGEQFKCPPPDSTYGFQKLATEYYARGAWEQYQLPFTIIRPFNCVGIGEKEAIANHEIYSGNIKLALSHVVPDIVNKLLKGQNPLHILGSGQQVRHYTYGGDIAAFIRITLSHDKALNNDFNISHGKPTTVLELAEQIWNKVNPDLPFKYVSDDPFMYDVQYRSPDVCKARDILGFEATTDLDTVLDEVIPWLREELEKGGR
jgi:UDP-glucose 4-epimerase